MKLRRLYFGRPWRWTVFLGSFVVRVGQDDRRVQVYNWRLRALERTVGHLVRAKVEAA